MTRAGAHAEAIEPFRRAVARDASKAGLPLQPRRIAAVRRRAQGRRSRVPPGAASRPARFHRAWSSLAQVARAPLTAAEVAALERALEHPALDADAELHLCHALAKQHEDEGRYAAAFRLLERGKRRKAASLGYDFAADRELVRGGRAPAGRARRPRRGDGHASREPIFIVGMPRTGTTLVERILSSHPQRVLRRRADELRARAEARDGDAVEPRARRRNAARPARAATSRPSARRTSTARGRAPGTRERFIDKMPLNFFYAPLIRRCLPNAKIVCLRRNPLDTCLSNYRQLFATSFSYYNYAYDLLDTGRYYAAFHALTSALARLARGELSRDPLRGRRRPHRARGTPAASSSASCPGTPGASPSKTTPRPSRRRAPHRFANRSTGPALERWRHYERELAPLRAAARRCRHVLTVC